MDPIQTSSDLPPWARTLLLAVFLAGVLPIAIYGAYRALTPDKALPVIQSELLDAYAEALIAGDFVEARMMHTSEFFRQNTSAEEFRRGQELNVREYGKLKSLTIYLCQGRKEPGRPAIRDCEVHYETERTKFLIHIDIVVQDGRYLIDQTYARVGPEDRREKRVF